MKGFSLFIAKAQSTESRNEIKFFCGTRDKRSVYSKRDEGCSYNPIVITKIFSWTPVVNTGIIVAKELKDC